MPLKAAWRLKAYSLWLKRLLFWKFWIDWMYWEKYASNEYRRNLPLLGVFVT